MVTSLNARTPARDIGYQMAQYICARINPVGVVTATPVNIKIGTIPAGSVITNLYSKVITAVTGGTVGLSAGTSATTPANNLVAAISASAGSEDLMPGTGVVQPLVADTDFYVGVTTTTTIAAGDLVVALQFMKPLS